MSDVSGIPNLGIPGMGFSGGVLGGNAATGQPAMSADQINASMWGRISPQQLQTTQNNIYGPMGFGGQTAMYAGLGAAYGRGTGGFGGLGAANADPMTPVGGGGGGGGGGEPTRVDVASSPFGVQNAGAVPYLSGGGMPFGGGGFGRMPMSAPPMQAQAPFQDYGLSNGSGLGSFSPSPNYPGGSSASATVPAPAQFSAFSRGPFQTAAPGGGIGAFNPTMADLGGGGAAPPSPPSYSRGGPFQTASPGDGAGAYFPTADYQTPFNTPSMLSGSGRFGNGPQASAGSPEFSPNQPDFGGLFSGLRSGLGRTSQAGGFDQTGDVTGTPDPNSIYQGFPHTEGGSTRGGLNAGGANPFTSDADPTTNLNGPFAAGRGFQTQEPSPFDPNTGGAPHIGPTMGPFMSASPGGGIGSRSGPPNFAPSSPFEGGGSPFNYAGDYRGSLRNAINQKTMGGDVYTGGDNNPPFDPSAPPPSRDGFGPSSPFVSGTPPVPFNASGGSAFPVPGIGGYRGTMRDQIAAIMSGSQGMNEPAYYDKGAIGTEVPQSGPPLVNGGPQGTGPVPMPQPRPDGAPLPSITPTQPQMGDAWSRIRSGPGSPGVSSIAQQTPPPEAPYAKINNAIFDIGNASRPGMFDNLARPLGQMFSPGQYRGLGR